LNYLLDISTDVFATFVGKIAQGTKSQANQLVIYGIKLAQGWNMSQCSSANRDVTLERAASRDEFGNSMSGLAIADCNPIQPDAKRVKHIEGKSTALT